MKCTSSRRNSQELEHRFQTGRRFTLGGLDVAPTCEVVSVPSNIRNLTTYVPGVSRMLPEIKERMGSLCVVGMEEEDALASPMFCGFVRGGLRAPGVGVEFSVSLSCRELTDRLLFLPQEKPKEGEAIVAIDMMLSWRWITSEGTQRVPSLGILRSNSPWKYGLWRNSSSPTSDSVVGLPCIYARREVYRRVDIRRS